MLPEAPRQPRFALAAGGGFLLLGGAVMITVTQVLDLSPQGSPGSETLLAALWLAVLASGALLYALLRPVQKRLQGLAESTETMRRLLESHPGSVFSLDLDGRYTNVYKTTALTGYAPEELVGRHHSELLIPEDRERVGEEFAAIVRGEPRVLETTILTRDGERIPASVTVIPVVARGRIVGVHGITQDISARKRVEHELRASELRYRSLFESSTDGILLTTPDGSIQAANPAACSILGRTEEEIVRLNRGELVDGEDALALERLAAERARTGRARGELWMKRGDGGKVRVELSGSRFTDESGRERASVIMRDVTERERISRQLQLAASALANTAEGVAIVDRRWRIVSVNPGFSRIADTPQEEALGRRPRIEFGNRRIRHLRRLRREIREHGYWQGEAIKRRHDGVGIPVLVSVSPVRDDRGRIANFVLVFNDISEHKDYERRLQHLAHHDLLTDLPNRSLLEERTRGAVIRARRHEQAMAILFVDLDRFKTVNDSLGHRAGDRLLQIVGERLRLAVRETDTVARLGGDEFAILLGELADARDAAIVAGKVLEVLKQPLTVAERSLYLGAGIGIACYPQDGEDFSSLMQNADTAMYRAKTGGRNSYQFYSSDMNTEAVHTLVLQSSLYQALENGEFDVYYQPFVDLGSGRITGMEALIRWRNPELGLVSPADFIPLAEETGLIVPIGEWVLREACATLRRLHHAGHEDLRVAVNLSARQFRQDDLAERVAAVLGEFGLDGRFLELEITETTVMDRVRDAIEAMQTLHGLGVTIALDDFGTGYSSLNYLKDFHINYLKVDKSFVQGVPGDEGSAAITRTVIAMARSLGIGVIAEGIETPAQLRALSEWECEEGQGYLLSVPLASEDLGWLLDTYATLPAGPAAAAGAAASGTGGRRKGAPK
ncbi:MAG TPA: EAL domain-containing protein [Gammaproteobacteria bacterium]|nr:EAL domain-containing protein [Gammaproteobacteria bacterium]